jgi:Transposase IS116/IS110/IS902 family
MPVSVPKTEPLVGVPTMAGSRRSSSSADDEWGPVHTQRAAPEYSRPKYCLGLPVSNAGTITAATTAPGEIQSRVGAVCDADPRGHDRGGEAVRMAAHQYSWVPEARTSGLARLLKRAPRLGGRLTEEIFAALAAQTVVVTGTNAAGVVLPRLAAQLAALRQQRAEVAEKVEELVAAHPLSKVLMTIPGVGVRTCARILTEVVGKDFPTAGHLASYAGLAPVTRRSGTSICQARR